MSASMAAAAWGGSTWDGIEAFEVSGGVVGGTIGYNYQINQFVIGVETDIDWSGIEGQREPVLCRSAARPETPGSAHCAAGSAMPSTASCPTSPPAPRSATSTATCRSFRAGAINQWAGRSAPALKSRSSTNITRRPNTSMSVSADFNCGLNCGLLPSANVSFHANLVRGGINIRF